MTEWALLRNGKIVNVVTTYANLEEMQKSYPGYVIKDIYTLPDSVLQKYQYWNERP